MLVTLALLFFLPLAVAWVVLGLSVPGLAVFLVLRKKQRVSGLWPCACACVLLSCALLLLQAANEYLPALRMARDKAEIHAVVLSNPEPRYGRYYYTLKAISVDGEPCSHKIRLTSRVPLYAEPYDEFRFTGRLYPLGGDADGLDNYRAKGIYLGSFSLNAYADDPIEVIPTGSRHPMKAILRWQLALKDNLERQYPGEPGALLIGMLLGDVNTISAQTRADFRNAGIAHLFSVSGIHMSMLSYSVFRFLLALKSPRPLAALLSCLFIIAFMAVTGFSAPCVRAGIMMLTLMAGECFYRKADALNSLGLAAFLLMLVSPFSAGQIGLQLSFGATLGIVLFHERAAGAVKRRTKKYPAGLRKSLNAIGSSVAVTASAMSLTLPVSLLRLPGGTSLVTLLSNLLLVPVSGASMVLGGASSLMGRVSFLQSSLKGLNEPAAELMLWAAGWLAKAPFPHLQGGDAPLLLPAAAIGLIFAAVALLLRYIGKPVRLRVTAGALAALLCLSSWLPGVLRRNDCLVQFLPVGQGMAVLVSREKRAALLACGGDDFPSGTTAQALSALGMDRIDFILIPAGGEAVDAGAKQILRDFPIGRALSAEPHELAERFAGQYALARGVSRAELWEGAFLLYSKEENTCILNIYGVEMTLYFDEAAHYRGGITYRITPAGKIYTRGNFI